MPNRALPACIVLAASLLFPGASHGQSMQDVLNELFVFGGGDDPLFLVGTAGQEATALHGDHFIPAESQANGVLLEFFNTAIAANIANFPLSSTVASKTFEFIDGVPTPTSNSFGPIYAERAQTIGRGRLNLGLNYSRLRFAEIRGVDLNDVRLTFVHINSDFDGCDAIFGDQDCTLYGVPVFENDRIDLTLDLGLEAELVAFYATFGVTDWLDLSVAIPMIDLQLRGQSQAVVTPASNPPFHFFGGTQEAPVLLAGTQAFGDATGIGDIAGRLKALIVRGDYLDFGLLAEVRAPTGRVEDFLGTGEWNARGLLITSGTFGDFSPHANLGYEYRGSEFDQDEIELIAGFDHRLAEWATLAIDFLGAFKVGPQTLTFPEDVTYQAPFVRTISVTNLPDRRDHVFDGSLGFKFQLGRGLLIISNVLVPLNEGGLRAGVTPTLGLEYFLGGGG